MNGNDMEPYGGSNQQGSSGMAVASMVLGILSIVLCCMWYAALPMGIIGLILGIVSLKKGNLGAGMAKAGIVTSVIGIVFVLVILLFLGAVFSEMMNVYPGF